MHGPLHTYYIVRWSLLEKSTSRTKKHLIVARSICARFTSWDCWLEHIALYSDAPLSRASCFSVKSSSTWNYELLVIYRWIVYALCQSVHQSKALLLWSILYWLCIKSSCAPTSEQLIRILKGEFQRTRSIWDDDNRLDRLTSFLWDILLCSHSGRFNYIYLLTLLCIWSPANQLYVGI